MDALLLGIDAGTTNVKAALVTPDGRVVAETQHGYGTQRLRAGWVEQDPADWWQGVAAATRAALAQAGARREQVAAIAVSGQGCAVTLIDDAGEVVRPAIIWMDSRSEPQCAQLRAQDDGQIVRISGKPPAPYNADPTLMWLQQHEPESIARARTSLTTSGYINFRLTGETVENSSDASILLGFDLARDDWSADLIRRFGLPRRLYPTVRPCTEVVGTLTAAAADDLGLQAGVPVVAGGEDTSAAGLAMGVVKPGQTLLSLGTAGTVYIVQDQVVTHPRLLSFRHVLPDQILIGGSMIAVGAALEWSSRALAPGMDYDAILGLAAASVPGAHGLLFLPYLSGELQPINDGNARGVFFGLSLNTEHADMVRATIEGAAFAIAHNLRTAGEAGITPSELRAVGGPTRSALWCQIIADITGVPLAVMGGTAGAPLGDALLAGVGAGLIADPAAVALQAAKVERVYEPEPTAQHHYAELYSVYEQLYPQLTQQFAALAAVRDFGF